MKEIVTLDGHKVPYVYSHPKNNAVGNIVLAHGITLDKNEYENLFVNTQEFFINSGFNVVRFDFRGHGESKFPQEKMTIHGESQDMKSICDYVEGLNDLPIFIVGCSFGAISTVIYSVSSERVKGLVLWNPVLNIKSTFPCPETEWAKAFFTKEKILESKTTGFLYLGNYKVGNDLVNEMLAFQLGDLIPEINVPVLIFHGDMDEIVPLRFTEEYYSKFKNCELIVLKGCGHGFLDKQIEVIKETCDWVLNKIELPQV